MATKPAGVNIDPSIILISSFPRPRRAVVDLVRASSDLRLTQLTLGCIATAIGDVMFGRGARC